MDALKTFVFGVMLAVAVGTIAIFLGSIIIQTILATFGGSLGRYIQNPGINAGT